MFKVPCGKCCGTGEIPAYRQILGGVCFACSGKGYVLQKAKPGDLYVVLTNVNGKVEPWLRLKAKSQS